MLLRHLAAAERHIAQGRARIEKQQWLIAELERNGYDTTQGRYFIENVRNDPALA
jgi:hypothetical protein